MTEVRHGIRAAGRCLYWPPGDGCENPSMRGLVIAACAALVTSGGCVQPQPPAPVEAPADREPAAAAPTPGAAPSDEAAQALPEPSTIATPPSRAPAEVAAAPPPAATPPPAPDAAVAAAERQAPPVPPEEPVAEQASTPAATSSAAAEPRTPPDESPLPAADTPPTQAEAPATLALDLAGLEQRLRDTHAIGVFTKLSLKNQVDDLLGQFRAFYRGQLKVQLADLRQRYELLLFKVLTLLQDSDRDLAEAIAASREAIWGILSDPQKLAQI